MYANNNDDDSNNGHDGFVWSGRLSVIMGFLLAAALAAAKVAPLLANTIEWQG
jgi:hypothetical protein